MFMKLKTLKFCILLIENKVSLKILRVVSRMWILRKFIEKVLMGLVKDEFAHRKDFKVHQNGNMLALAKKGHPWKYVVKNSNKRVKENKNYNHIELFGAGSYHVVEMVRVN